MMTRSQPGWVRDPDAAVTMNTKNLEESSARQAAGEPRDRQVLSENRSCPKAGPEHP